MNIGPIKRRTPSENTVPMINVVFLLLIFFLMSAQIAPPEPFEVEVPSADSIEPAEAEMVVHLSATGEIAFREHRGEAALAALRGLGEIKTLYIRSDRNVDAAQVASLLKRLPEFGVTSARLISTVK